MSKEKETKAPPFFFVLGLVVIFGFFAAIGWNVGEAVIWEVMDGMQEPADLAEACKRIETLNK